MPTPTPTAHPITALDVAGRALAKGDTVATLNGQTTGRVWEINREDDGTAFVQVRPVHQPYAQAVWHSADQLIWVATPRVPAKKDAPSTKTTAAKSPKTVTQTAPKKRAPTRKPPAKHK